MSGVQVYDGDGQIPKGQTFYSECSKCGGTGSIIVLVDDPKHKKSAEGRECPDCNGEGKLVLLDVEDLKDYFRPATPEENRRLA